MSSSITAHGTPASTTQAGEGAVPIVDDDAGMRDSLVTLLGAYGFQVLAASDGVRALQVVRESAPRVVLTDILMPGQDGMETIKEMKRMHPDVKIIAMSGGGEIDNMDYLDYARMLGADATINKPADIDELVQLLGSLLRGATAEPRG
jgi:DNA-binding response OmpR family regulator